MRSIGQLRQDAKTQAYAYADRDRGLMPANTTSPGGGGGTDSVNVIVTGFGNASDSPSGTMTMYRVKRIDLATGLPVGDEFKVRVFSLPSIAGHVGQQEVRDCQPNWDVGEPMEISRRVVFDGTALVDDWWVIGATMKYGCG